MRLLAKLWTCVILTLPVLTMILPPERISAEPSDRAEDLLTRNEVIFLPNQGQWPEVVLFRTVISGVTIWFTRDAVYHQFSRPLAEGSSSISTATGFEPVTASPRLERMMVAAQFVGSNPDPIVVGRDAVDYLTNFLIGDDPSQWQTDIPGYRTIEYQSIYPGIDVRYLVIDGKLEYDLILAPGADPKAVEINYQNGRKVSIDGLGDLVVTTAWGEIREQAPVIYQLVDNQRWPLAGRFRLINQSAFRFELIDQPKADYPVIIDPVVTYTNSFGGSGNDEGFGIAVDHNGNAYVTGYTSSSDFPVVNPFQVDTGGGYYDAFVAKLTSSGTGLVYSSYLGGSSDDRGHSIAVDTDGSAYVTGYTYSNDFPTQDPYQSSHGGGVSDVFVVKLNPQGNGFEYATYLGGLGRDVGEGIVVDDLGQAYLTGYTRSTNFPTVNPFQGSLAGINFDAFLTQLSSDGGTIEYSSYLGGSVSDYGRNLALDKFGSVYVVGYTKSTDFPTLNPFQTENSGDFDAFVTRFNLSGSEPMFSTYLGGSGADYAEGVVVDSNLYVSLSGYTTSTDFPTLNAYQPGHGGGLRDMFLARFNSSGRNLLNSTYLGGSGEDYCFGLAATAQGNLCLTGTTYSEDFPLVKPHQPTLNGSNDAFLSILSSTGDLLEYSTYLGGSLDDIGYDITVDAIGNTFLTGVTGETFSPASNGDPDYLAASGGMAELFVTKFTDEALCCGAYTSGLTGNADCSADGKRNLSDITRLIDRVYVSKKVLCCERNGNINGDLQEKINLGDITRLIDHVYISKSETAGCL